MMTTAMPGVVGDGLLSGAPGGITVEAGGLPPANSDDPSSHLLDGDDGGELGGTDLDGQSQKKWIWVLDPLTRKLRVPLNLLVPTQATAVSGTVPSLCMGFLEGRCRHQWCRQAHVLPQAISQLRHEALHAPTCCKEHHDPHDISALTKLYSHIRIVHSTGGGGGGGGNSSSVNGSSARSRSSSSVLRDDIDTDDDDEDDLIPTTRVANTVGLLRYLVHNTTAASTTSLPGNIIDAAEDESTNPLHTSSPSSPQLDHESATAAGGAATGIAEGRSDSETASRASDTPAITTKRRVLRLPTKCICRLHLAHRCRYLEDCNNIHLCREYESRIPPPPNVLSQLVSLHSGVKEVTLGDVVYEVTPIALGADISSEDFKSMVEQHKEEFTARQASTRAAAAAAVAVPGGPAGALLGAEGAGSASSPLTSDSGLNRSSNALASTSSTSSFHQGSGPSFRVHDLLSKHYANYTSSPFHHQGSNSHGGSSTSSSPLFRGTPLSSRSTGGHSPPYVPVTVMNLPPSVASVSPHAFLPSGASGDALHPGAAAAGGAAGRVLLLPPPFFHPPPPVVAGGSSGKGKGGHGDRGGSSHHHHQQQQQRHVNPVATAVVPPLGVGMMMLPSSGADLHGTAAAAVSTSTNAASASGSSGSFPIPADAFSSNWNHHATMMMTAGPAGAGATAVVVGGAGVPCPVEGHQAPSRQVGAQKQGGRRAGGGRRQHAERD